MTTSKKNTPRLRSLTFPITLIAWPAVTLLVLYSVTSIIYSQFHPPAVFDELTNTSTATERIAYSVNSILFSIIGIIALLVGPVSFVIGIAILVKNIVSKEKYAKN